MEVTQPDSPTADAALRLALLFFPGNRPDQMEKAIRTGAEMVCVDLEDAVAPDQKPAARGIAADLLRRPRSPGFELVLRINSPRREAGLRDVMMMLDAGAAPDALLVPKVDGPDEIRWLDGVLTAAFPELKLIPLVETCEGLERAAEIATASPRVTALLLGGVDLSSELGCAFEWEPLLYARSRVVHAASRAGVDALDTPFLDTADMDGLAGEARRAARLGFSGKAAIHPAQVTAIQDAFAPDADEVGRAREVMAAYERNRGGVLLMNDRLVERPVIRSAQRTLAIAAARSERDRRPGTGR